MLSFAGDRASEGRDGEVGQDLLLRGHADGVRGALLTLLVQPLLRAELQEVPRGHHGSAGRDHRGERHRDPAGVVQGGPQGRGAGTTARLCPFRTRCSEQPEKQLPSWEEAFGIGRRLSATDSITCLK